MPSKFIDGTALQVTSSLTLGQPFEVWKTRMGRHRSESTLEAFCHIYRRGGAGAFWTGLGPKMFESATKGGVLLVTKDAVREQLCSVGVHQSTAGFAAGAIGGIAQTAVIGPATFLNTAVVLGKQGVTSTSVFSKTWNEKGVMGFYKGASAIAARQASNWASRQGFTDAVRSRIALNKHGNARASLSTREEICAGVIGGLLSSWNHPFEVARIEMQARAAAGETEKSMVQVLRHIHAEYGISGLFKGLVPRIGLNIWSTLFLVSGANFLKHARQTDLNVVVEPLRSLPKIKLRTSLTES